MQRKETLKKMFVTGLYFLGTLGVLVGSMMQVGGF